jgi:hypothetical protein
VRFFLNSLTEDAQTSTNAPANDVGETVGVFVTTKTYLAGEVMAVGRRKYQALISALGSDYLDISKWAYIGKTNPYRWSDEMIYTQTVGAKDTPLHITLAIPESIECLALFQTWGQSVTVSIKNGDVVAWSKTIPLIDDRITDIVEYMRQEFSPTSVTVIDLPFVFGGSTVEIDIACLGGYAKLGYLAGGNPKQIGQTLADPAPKIARLDFSRIVRDENFGTISLTPRYTAKKYSFVDIVEKSLFDRAQYLYNEITGKAAVFQITSSMSSFTVLGVLKVADCVVSYPEYTEFDIEIEGMV